MVLVSVIIPVLDAEETIERCLNAMLNQKEAPTYEVIVVDNGSKDNTAEILKNFDEVGLFTEPKKGSYAARNTGIRNARGNVILFTDADCIASPYWIKHMYKALSRKVKAVAGQILATYKNSSLLDYCNEFCHTQQIYTREHFIATSNMAIRKQDLLDAGLFNDQLLSGGDFELCSRAIKPDDIVTYAPKGIVYHHYPDSFSYFMKDNFNKGKWQGLIEKQYGKNFAVKSNTCFQTFMKKPHFLFFKLFHTITFRLGILYGHVINLRHSR